MKNNVLSIIKSEMPNMSKGQRRISEYILTHYEKAAYMTASKLGKNSGVSESTVVRFANELGYEGYPEFLHALQEAVGARLTAVQRIEVTDERIGNSSVLEKTLLSDISKIKATLEANDRIVFDSAIDAIINARNVYIAGARSTSMLAELLSYNLNLVFDNIRHVNTTSSGMIFEQMLRIGEGDVFIAMTFPRYSKRIVKAVEFAKNSGAFIIAITDSENSPIASHADELLIAKSDMASYMDSLVAPLSLINAIIVSISRKKKDVLAETFERLERVWEEQDIYDKAQDNV